MTLQDFFALVLVSAFLIAGALTFLIYALVRFFRLLGEASAELGRTAAELKRAEEGADEARAKLESLRVLLRKDP